MSKYLKQDDFKGIRVDLNSFTPETTDSISEQKILKKIVETECAEEFFCVAAQLAIVGYGQSKFEKYNYNGQQKELKSFFRTHKVKDDANLGSDISEDELTPRRIIRVFRFHIKQFLQKNKEHSSYFWRKYTDQNEEFRSISFPGAEHLVTTIEEASYLLSGYIELDKQLKEQARGYGLTSRINRVLRARKLIVKMPVLTDDDSESEIGTP